MNLYILDLDPTKAAQCLGDKHLSRQIVECTQMLVNCFPQELLDIAPRTEKGTIRHHAFLEDYCAMWARRRVTNAVWVLSHAISCEVERRYRFPHAAPHPCLRFLQWVSENTILMECLEMQTMQRRVQTPFIKKMPFHYKKIKDAVLAYRVFYKYEKAHVHQWTHRGPPRWLSDRSLEEARMFLPGYAADVTK